MPQGWTVVPEQAAAPSGWTPVAEAPVSAPSGAAPPAPAPNTLGTFVSRVGAQINPIAAVQGLASAVAHPIDTVKNIGQAQGAVFDKAKASYDQGDYGTAARHFVNYLIPLVGPVLDEASDKTARGEIAAGAGDAVGLGLAMFGPKAATSIAASRAPLANRASAITKPQLTRPDSPVAFAQREGIPLDVATASGNRFARGVQKLADESLGGSVVAEKAGAATSEALTRAGAKQAARTGVGPTMPEQAGAAVTTGVEDAIRRLSKQADDAYRRVDALTEGQQQTVQMGTKTTQTGVLDAAGQPITRDVPITETLKAPVDVAPVKAALRPLYDTLKREAELVPLQGAKARALTALDRLLSGPDRVALATADAATGELGALAGTASLARTPGQGVAAQAFIKLRTAVNQAATQAGPDVFKALESGRQATKAKWAAIDVLDDIASEPVQAFKRATWADDAGIGKLREVAKLAPEAMPHVARAYLDDLLSTATEHGGFAHAQKLASSWDKLGPQTKQLLFKDPAYVADLTNFFQIAKRLAENPNPSGSALTLWKGGEMTGLVTAPAVGVPYSIGMTALAKAMHSKAGVRLVTEGLKIPVKNPTAVKMWAARAVPFFNALQQQGTGAAPTPATATAERGATR